MCGFGDGECFGEGGIAWRVFAFKPKSRHCGGAGGDIPRQSSHTISFGLWQGGDNPPTDGHTTGLRWPYLSSLLEDGCVVVQETMHGTQSLRTRHEQTSRCRSLPVINQVEQAEFDYKSVEDVTVSEIDGDLFSGITSYSMLQQSNLVYS